MINSGNQARGGGDSDGNGKSILVQMKEHGNCNSKQFDHKGEMTKILKKQKLSFNVFCCSPQLVVIVFVIRFPILSCCTCNTTFFVYFSTPLCRTPHPTNLLWYTSYLRALGCIKAMDPELLPGKTWKTGKIDFGETLSPHIKYHQKRNKELCYYNGCFRYISQSFSAK